MRFKFDVGRFEGGLVWLRDDRFSLTVEVSTGLGSATVLTIYKLPRTVRPASASTTDSAREMLCRKAIAQFLDETKGQHVQSFGHLFEHTEPWEGTLEPVPDFKR